MEATTSSGQTENTSGATETNSGEADKTVAYSSHQKLLGEKKKLQVEFEAMKTKLEEIETEKLLSSGKLKEHSESLNKQLNEAKTKERSLHKLYSDKIIKQQFNAEASKLGCVEPDDAYKLCDLQGVEVKDDFSLDGEGLKSALNELQKKKPYLFKKEVNGPKDRSPSNSINNQKPIDQLTKDEQLAALAKLL